MLYGEANFEEYNKENAMQRKRTLWLSLVVLLGLLVSACAAPAAAPAAPAETGGEAAAEAGEAAPAEGGTLTLSLGEDFTTFHPYFDVNTRYFKPHLL